MGKEAEAWVQATFLCMFAFNRKLLEARCLNAKNLNPVLRISGRSVRGIFCGVCGDFLQITSSRQASASSPLNESGAQRAGGWGWGRPETQAWRSVGDMTVFLTQTLVSE